MNTSSLSTPVSDKQQSKQAPADWDWDKFGRTGYTQVLHVHLWYADGTEGEINVTSPHIVWGDNVDTQWVHVRSYIKSLYDRLGIIKYQAHLYINAGGELNKALSYCPFDLILNKPIEE